MGININQCRKILGDAGKNLSDQEIETMKNTFLAITDLIIDMEINKFKLKKYVNSYENQKVFF
jgi:hypothetical protein